MCVLIYNHFRLNRRRFFSSLSRYWHTRRKLGSLLPVIVTYYTVFAYFNLWLQKQNKEEEVTNTYTHTFVHANEKKTHPDSYMNESVVFQPTKETHKNEANTEKHYKRRPATKRKRKKSVTVSFWNGCIDRLVRHRHRCITFV